MADYQQTADENVVLRVADHVFIPNDDGNIDWQTYRQWLADGGVPDPVFVIAPALDSVGTGKTTNQILGAT